MRVHALDAAKAIKQDGKENDLIQRILSDEAFDITEKEMDTLLCADSFTGRAKEQTEEFLLPVQALLKENRKLLDMDVQITV